MCEFPKGAVTKDYRSGGFISSHIRSLRVLEPEAVLDLMGLNPGMGRAGPIRGSREHQLLLFLASSGATSLACSPSLSPHSHKLSISCLSASDPPPPSYKDPVMTLGPWECRVIPILGAST